MKEFEKVIGYNAIKQELIRISDVLKNNDAYKKLCVNAPRGLLLHGEPGVGKTLMASCIIAASGRKAFICRKDKPNGDFVNAIKKTFSDAKAAAPSIVFLDDMDKFANGDESHTDAEEYVTVQACIDEVRDSEVFVLATANSLRVLPGSLKRVGRFDRIIKICNPDGEDAIRIISHYISKKKFVGDIDPISIARIMEGRSCAELETVINEAGLYAGYERSDKITMEHFMRACLHTVFNVPNGVLNAKMPKINLSDSKNPMTKVIYHEAGHATIAEVLKPGTVTLVSAYKQAGDTGGFTAFCKNLKGNSSSELCLEEDDDYLNDLMAQDNDTIDEIHAEVLGSLGGMAALEQRFGIIDTGTRSDLNRAFDYVSDLVIENCTCGFQYHSDGYRRSDSQELMARQEQAVAAEMERYYRKTKEILALNHELLDAIALELSRKGVLTAADIAEIKKDCRVVLVGIQ
ncbi:MAG: AAA family ATPase [Clostridiales bacterium]|nr:AAA family ATPase [Clostridiales bacterium]